MNIGHSLGWRPAIHDADFVATADHGSDEAERGILIDRIAHQLYCLQTHPSIGVDKEDVVISRPSDHIIGGDRESRIVGR